LYEPEHPIDALRCLIFQLAKHLEIREGIVLEKSLQSRQFTTDRNCGRFVDTSSAEFSIYVLSNQPIHFAVSIVGRTGGSINPPKQAFAQKKLVTRRKRTDKERPTDAEGVKILLCRASDMNGSKSRSVVRRPWSRINRLVKYVWK
jgi:hypothetical protein